MASARVRLVEWCLTRDDRDRLELEYRAKRRASHQKTDSHSISQLLRAVGGMLDQKAGRLVTLARDDQTVSVEYLLPSGQKIVDEYSPSMLYDLWVRMYKKRTLKV